jgi:transcriptional regulator with XRE-family HTH domain
MPIRNITPSSYVGPQVRKFRDRKGWSQEELADRLDQLGAKATGKWSQTKVHKLEAGKLARVLVDDVFELALALDVSPLYLLTPTQAFDEQENALKVWLGGKVTRWPSEVRQWVRGVRPILGLVDYRSNEEAERGYRFYLLESPPPSEWAEIEKAGEYAKDMSGLRVALQPGEEDRGE